MPHTLTQLKREFLEHCELEKGRSKLTIENYSRYLDRFFDFLAKELNQTVLNIDDISLDNVRKYRLHINRLHDQTGRDLKSSTQNYHIIALRANLRYLAWRGIETLPAEKVAVAKLGDREINFLAADEVQSILNGPDLAKVSGLRDRALMEVLFSTGVRVSELAAMNMEDINFERGEVTVLGKGKKLRVVFLSP